MQIAMIQNWSCDSRKKDDRMDFTSHLIPRFVVLKMDMEVCVSEMNEISAHKISESAVKHLK